ncbi:arginine repressor [Anaeromassilibacillus sp. An200]|uniref:Arginine repressor n=1 Tax=Candidatus Caccousia stercoris TaxID=2840723 RepID=A0A9D1K1R7_9FIRM|nr:arginine repressor [Anaeromassilibacillus sp. An200]OUP08753.1 arginine repressor [Anaeromassilibacillus sp. An200]HIS78620.1 arginine repressor [Candidatus Caccousia stercoris]
MKKRRHEKILQIIGNNTVDTQEELLRLLREEGFDVTQATVSRDIKELRLVKTQTGNGKYRYTAPKDGSRDMSSRFFSLFSENTISVQSACNMVVIKSLTGMAQAVCAAMDSLHWEGIVGTLAGDDTIFVVTQDEECARRFAEELRRMMG